MSLRALQMDTLDEMLKHNHPGSFCIDTDCPLEALYMHFICPCGTCGRTQTIYIGYLRLPKINRPSWMWNGSLSEPTLTPEAIDMGHWRGWLRNGYWEAC